MELHPSEGLTTCSIRRMPSPNRKSRHTPEDPAIVDALRQWQDNFNSLEPRVDILEQRVDVMASQIDTMGQMFELMCEPAKAAQEEVKVAEAPQEEVKPVQEEQKEVFPADATE